MKKTIKKKDDNKTEKKKTKEPEALFIPAGVLLGMGLGFLYNELVTGLFIGLGIGFLIFAIISTLRHRC